MKKSCLLILAFIIFSTDAFPQNQKVGRLPDGRAFRTANDGTQLVDYIAELELEVESLKRQVQGLEDESKNKQEKIDRLEKGQPAEASLKEKDLLSKKIEPELPKIQPEATECKPKIIEKVVEKVVEKPGACLPVSAEPNKNLLQQIKTLNDQLENASRQLEERQVDIDILNAKLENQKKVMQVNALIKQSEPVTISASGTNSYKPDRVNDTRFRAVDSLRGSMLRDLKSFEDLLIYRDKLYAKLPAGSYSQPEKISVQDFKNKLQEAGQVYDLSLVRTRINEERGKVQQDIALYKRELKIR